MWRLLSSVTLAALLSFSAGADIALGDVNVQEATLAGEWDLVDIYDAIFGTSYATTLSSNDLYLLVGVDPDDYNGPTNCTLMTTNDCSGNKSICRYNFYSGSKPNPFFDNIKYFRRRH